MARKAGGNKGSQDKVLEVGALKWCKEHVPRDGNDWTEEGQMLLDDPELWLDRLTSHGNVTHPEREIVPRKTALSYYIKRVPSPQPLQVTGF